MSAQFLSGGNIKDRGKFPILDISWFTTNFRSLRMIKGFVNSCISDKGFRSLAFLFSDDWKLVVLFYDWNLSPQTIYS